MSKYYGSPWGTMRGKLHDAVGGGWKGINWVRVNKNPTQRGTLENYQKYKDGLIPIEAFSFPQFNLRRCVTGPLGYISRMNLENYIYAVWEPWCKKLGLIMSGTNALIKENASALLESMTNKAAEYDPATNTPDLKVLNMARGDLEPTPELTTIVYDPADGGVTGTWNKTIKSNGADSDIAHLVFLRKPLLESYGRYGTWEPALILHYPAILVEINRDDGAGADFGNILPVGLDADDLTAFIFFEGNPNIAGREHIGNSNTASVQVTAAP